MLIGKSLNILSNDNYENDSKLFSNNIKSVNVINIQYSPDIQIREKKKKLFFGVYG